MLERLLIAALLIGLSLAAWIALNRLTLRRLRAEAPRDPLLAALRPGVPAIVYFTTPSCAPCRTQQQPALAQLQAERRDAIQVLQIDATAQPDVADRWGVFSAPTTFILDGAGQPRHVNRGVAPVEVLRCQIDQIEQIEQRRRNAALRFQSAAEEA